MTSRLILLLAGAATWALFAVGGAGAVPSTPSTELSPAETVLLRVVNDVRVENGLRPLRVDGTLERAARSHTSEMLAGNFFAHGDFGGRMAQFGVQGSVLGENLAWGSGSYARATSVVTHWLHSPEHRANLLRPGFTRVGIGALEGSFLGYRGTMVVTADFAGS